MKRPYALFVGDARDQLAAKTALGVLHWRPEWCLAQVRLPGCRAVLGLPEMTVEEAAARGAATLLIGVANAGGFIPSAWTETLLRAVEAGLDLASGLHQQLIDIEPLRTAADAHGRRLIDVRRPPRSFAVGTGEPRSGRRLLTVGTDCSIGKMYTALSIERELKTRGVSVNFRATGQTGIFIAGRGVAVDAVVADFISGAVEWLCPEAAPDHWDVIEGQGSLYHPSFAGVSLGLLHGAQAEALVMCHDPTRLHMRGLPRRALPNLVDCISLNEQSARLTCAHARCVGVALITAGMTEREAEAARMEVADRTGLPCVDPLVNGVTAIVDRILE